MKKTLSITAVLGLALSMTAIAAADPVQTVEDTTPPTTSTTTTTPTTTTTTPVIEASATTSTYSVIDEPVIKADEVVLIPTKVIQLTKKTNFYDMPNGKIIGALAPQEVDTTTTSSLEVVDGEWVEIYTWLGTAWIYVGSN